MLVAEAEHGAGGPPTGKLLEDGPQHRGVVAAVDGTHRAIDVENEAEVPARPIEEALTADVFEQPPETMIIAQLSGFDRYPWVTTSYLPSSTVAVPVFA